ncbi:MAG: peptide deformylase [Oscillospiraceae bacterium]|nr:peptide deformylase [Oscillospiraceae bacterium]MDD6085256.1 peptide deformylase [Oscillospiraceae bacterium]MDY3257186.1 peptide deformylase [Ruminococcus callidus]
MAIRKIVQNGDPILRTVCRPVEKFDKKLWDLLDDMQETLKKADGVGLAAPQVGIRRRIFIMDVGEGLIEMINPVITEKTGEQREVEGCLSCPQQWGYVKRPEKCKVVSYNRKGEKVEYSLSGLAAICACHETDHLDGKLFIDFVDEFVTVEEKNK